MSAHLRLLPTAFDAIPYFRPQAPFSCLVLGYFIFPLLVPFSTHALRPFSCPFSFGPQNTTAASTIRQDSFSYISAHVDLTHDTASHQSEGDTELRPLAPVSKITVTARSMENSYSSWVYVRTFHVAIPPRVLLRLMQFRNLITYPKEYEGMAASIRENLN